MDNFVKTLIEEVKSQGVFDEFRFNCCLADVDTKPAYQNVRNRVETAVNDFLAKQHWTPDTNKVQLRERLRKHLLDSDVLDKGVDHIVDQVVNPKVATIFEPKIESIAYKYLGITPPPPPANPPPRPPLLPAPPLPPYTGHSLRHMNGGNLLKVETTASLLPTDLEQISPDSDRATVKSDSKDDSKDDELPPGVDGEDILDDDDTTSPAFEPASSIKEDTNNASLNTSDSIKDVKELTIDSRDAGASQASQLSQVSSDSRLTIASTDAPQPTSANNSVDLASNIAANISEEAQMPKFNENSSDTNDNSGRQLHFDIKQDAITFEGTERRNSLSDCTNGATHALSIEDAIMCEVKANINDGSDVAMEPIPKPPPDPTECDRSLEDSLGLFAESTPNSQPVIPKDSTTPQLPPLPELPQVPERKPELPHTAEAGVDDKKTGDTKADDTKVDDTKVVESKVDYATVSESKVDNATLNDSKADISQAVESEHTSTTLPILIDDIKNDNRTAEFTASPASASSSSQTKKQSHSRDKDRRQHSHSRSDDRLRRKSRERENDKSRTKTSSSSKHSSHTSHSSTSKHRSSSSKYDKSSATTTSSRSNHESSSKRSSTRHESSSTHKKHKSSSSVSRSDRDRPRSRESRESHSHSHQSRSHNGSGSSSSNSKRSDRDRERDRERDRNKSSSNSTSNSTSNSISAVVQDDHNEVKAKLQKRHSTDSNDEGKPPGWSSKSHAEPADTQNKEKTTETAAQNGNKASETNGTNGTNNNESAAELVHASNVVIISDILQQSTASFIELSSAGALLMPVEDSTKSESSENDVKPLEQPVEPRDTGPQRVVEPEITTATEYSDASAELDKTPIAEPAGSEQATTEDEIVKDMPAEPDNTDICPQPVDAAEVTTAARADAELADKESISLEETSNTQPDDIEGTPEASETITHFEQDAEVFKARLELIEQHIKDRRQLLNVLGELGETSCPRRSLIKRRLSSEAASSKQHSSSSASSNSSSGSPNAKAKRTRRDDAKTSPTPSEISVNSKENEELEKHEKVSLKC
ncbi:biorientation of chromosomes in cell division protein 1-like 1 isoform X2 [Drosophila montana]|uniref:biorientation of chromosomes in cell division protein 1-like 1 isoform X2 n=1 Tax=Drosophila montana TaxID=40370 RepID=UPI00313C0437